MPDQPAENIRLRPALEDLPVYVPGKPSADDGVRRFKISSNESSFAPIPAVPSTVAGSWNSR